MGPAKKFVPTDSHSHLPKLPRALPTGSLLIIAHEDLWDVTLSSWAWSPCTPQAQPQGWTKLGLCGDHEPSELLPLPGGTHGLLGRQVLTYPTLAETAWLCHLTDCPAVSLNCLAVSLFRLSGCVPPLPGVSVSACPAVSSFHLL